MRRRNSRKKNALDYIAIPRVELEAETKRGILIILILALGAVSLLGLFDLAGSLGSFLTSIITWLFGWGKWLIPLLLLTLSFLMYNRDKYAIRGVNYLGMLLFLIAFHAFLHFFIPLADWKGTIEAGDGGGYFGMLMASIFNSLLGFWGGLLILILLLLASLMLMFDMPLGKLIGAESLIGKITYPFRAIFGRLFNRRAADYEEEEIEEEISNEEEEEIEEAKDIELAQGFNQTKVGEAEEPEFMEEETAKPKKTETNEMPWKASHIQIDLPLELLANKGGKPTSGDIKNNCLIIQRTLENFGINVEMGEISVGPTVTQYTFKPAEGVKLSRITTLNNDLALALAAHPIRIEAPIPGKALVGIEVPNKSKAIVGLKEILEDTKFKGRKSNLMIALGKDVAGECWLYELPKMPHLLVAGATNSGKSVCLNAIIISLLYQNNPDDLKFIMVDPKRVELPVYNQIPHLLTPVITDVPKTINALKWCLNEMDRRFELLAKHGKRNIQAYNESVKKGGEKIPYLVFIVDELADLMVVAAKDIEASVIRLAQMARAVGIHLILATQRPSVDVITGLIKANMPARIAFSVASGVDSKTILDSLGAEKLLGQGDMLFVTAEISKPKRIQGAYVGDNEIKRIVDYLRSKAGAPAYIEGITERQKVRGMGGVGLEGNPCDEVDELFEEAKEIVINTGKASASLLQRRLSIGYARAARVLDELEENGVIGPSNGAKPREIMVTKDQYASHLANATAGVSLHSREESEAPEEFLENEEENSLGEEADTPTIFSSNEKENENNESNEGNGRNEGNEKNENEDEEKTEIEENDDEEIIEEIIEEDDEPKNDIPPEEAEKEMFFAK